MRGAVPYLHSSVPPFSSQLLFPIILQSARRIGPPGNSFVSSGSGLFVEPHLAPPATSVASQPTPHRSSEDYARPRHSPPQVLTPIWAFHCLRSDARVSSTRVRRYVLWGPFRRVRTQGCRPGRFPERMTTSAVLGNYLAFNRRRPIARLLWASTRPMMTRSVPTELDGRASGDGDSPRSLPTSGRVDLEGHDGAGSASKRQGRLSGTRS